MKKRILALFVAIISLLTVGAYGCGDSNNGGGSSQVKIPEKADYSSFSDLHFDFYGYSGYSDGVWNIDGTNYYANEDFRTVERIKEYKDCGMTILFPQSPAMYWGQDYETSQTKKVLDQALEAGMDKVILMDSRIQALSRRETSLIGTDETQYADETALDAVIAEYLEPYKDHEAFYGVMLGDEPFYPMATAYGQVYKSIKRVCPDCYVQYNLNPITAGNKEGRFPPLTAEEKAGKDEKEQLAFAYEKYVRLFMDATGADYIQYDHYPLKKATTIEEDYIYGLQLTAKLANEYNAALNIVTQTYGQGESGNYRKLTEGDLYWLNNMLIGFGVKTISYFTYFTKADNNAEHFIDGNSFITWYGEKTNIYTWMQQIMKEEQKLAPMLMNFKYRSSKVYLKAPTVFDSSYAMWTMETDDFVALKDVSVNKEVALVTELHDAERGNYVYMVQNIVDPRHKGSKAFQATEITFDSKYTHAIVYHKGEATVQPLTNGKLTLKHAAGQASYVLPF